LKEEKEKLEEINDSIREGKIAVASAKRQRESLVRMKEELNKELGKHRADQRTLERRLKNEFLTASEKARLEKQLSYAVSLQRDKQRQIKQRDGEISEIDEGLLPKESEVQTLEGEVDQHNQTTKDLREKLRVAEKAYETEQQKINGEEGTIIIEEGNKEKAKEVYYRSFLLEILNSRLSWGEEVKAKSLGDVNLGAEAKLLTFTLDPINFFERLRIWDDLRFAQPEKWPEALSLEERKYILDNFKLYQKPAKADEQSQDEDKGSTQSKETKEAYEQARKAYKQYIEALRREAKNYWWDNLMTTALGMLLPLLVLIFKLTLPEGLKRYYSKRYQAFCGHPDAVRELSFEKVKS
jgi:hypothetical protein